MRAILHVDMDAFYASVEELDCPALKGRPLIVGGTSGRGVVAAANYAVRRFGVHSAMPMREALRRCPQAVCVAPRMPRYQEISAQVFAIFHNFTPLVEGLSLDEAFLDVTASERLLGKGEIIAADIRARIARQTGLTASVGVAANKLLAKLASDLNKPDGMFHITEVNLRQVLDPLPVEKLFGVGPKTLPAVHAQGIRSIGDLRNASEVVLWSLFGKHGNAMRERACGIDERGVDAHRDEKSISAEETFRSDVRDARRLHVRLLQLVDRTVSRLRAQGLFASTVTVKIRRSDFSTFTRQRSGRPTQDTAALSAVARTLLEEWLTEHAGSAVRLLGVGVSGLRAMQQDDLFGAACVQKTSRLDAAVDGIRERFGSGLVTRASLLARQPSSTKPAT